MDGVGGDMAIVWKFFFAFLVVLILIGVAAWLVRRFGMARTSMSNNRGRMPRLAVIDATAVDSRRRLVLVRRDNVEHLLMIGGPSDIVVEPNIQRAPMPRGAEMPGRAAPPMAEPGWGEPDLAPRPEPVDFGAPPMPEPPSRPMRAPERRSDPPMAPPPAEPLFLPDPVHLSEDKLRDEPPMTRPAPAPRPMPAEPPLFSAPPRPAAPPLRPVSPPEPVRSEDESLTEMAQRLEAALRRPALGDTPPRQAARPAAPAPSVVPAAPTAPVAPIAPAAPAPSASAAPIAPTTPADAAAKPAFPSHPPDATPPLEPKSDFKALENEMASLLGRSKNPT